MPAQTGLHRARSCVAVTLLMVLVPTQADAAPATFNTALPVSEGHVVVRQQIIVAEADRGSDRLEERTIETVGGYGLTPDLALFVAVPWADRELHAAFADKRSVAGFGDVRAFARYTLIQRDRNGQTLRLAPFVGVELPTGKDSAADEFGQLPPGLQPGSGSLDLVGGVVGSIASIDWNLDAQLAWQENREAGLQAQGDVFRADLSVQKRLLPAAINAGTRGFLFGGVELNYLDQRRSRLAGVPIPGTAGERLFISPVLQYSQRRWMAEAALQIPVTQSLDQSNFSQDFVLRFGVRANI